MLPFVIGAVTGLVTVIGIRVFLKKNEPLIYALVLSGIGFLYVGYTWMDSVQLILTGIQAVLFLLIAAYGTRNISLLAAGCASPRPSTIMRWLSTPKSRSLLATACARFSESFWL